jgi:lipoprotein-anchoring transpeptidase ErfK/SrfK
VKIAPLLAVSAALALAPPAALAADPNATDLPPGPTATTTWVAKVVFPTVARSRPGGGRIVTRLATTARWNHGPNQLKVIGSARDKRGRAWLHVLLPIRPNGAKGWMLRDYALLSTTPWRIDITLRRRLVRVYNRGVLKRRFRIVIGKPSTPTPRGQFAIYEIVRQANPRGFLGPWVLHLTAHSNVLFNFGGGPGTIALHGRDGASLADPLGSARSHGCMRMADRNIIWLARRVVPGTPVNVH